MANAAIRGASELLGMTKGGEEPCDPREGDPDCVPVAEDDDLLDDDQVLDSEQGKGFVSVLHGIQNKIKDISSGKLLVSRNNLLEALSEINDDVDQILSSIKTAKD